MAGRSNDRINIIVNVISELLGLDEKIVRECVINTETGQKILDKNQAVLHDQATANIYDILTEISESFFNVKWDVADIARIYNMLIISDESFDDRTKFARFSKKEKDAVRKTRKVAKKSLLRDAEAKRDTHRIIKDIELDKQSNL